MLPANTTMADAINSPRGIDISAGKSTIDLHTSDIVTNVQSGMAVEMANLTGKLSSDIEPEMKQPEFGQPNRKQRRAMDRKAGKPTASQRLNDRVQTQQRLNNFYKHNTLWDDLENVFQQCAAQLVTCLQTITQDLKDPMVTKWLIPENVADIQTAFIGMTQDSESLSNALAEIHARHANNSGTTRSQDETSRAHLVMNDYTAWQLRYEALVKPNFAYLTEQIGLAAQRSTQVGMAVLNQSSTDPSVVTDVVAKEVTV